MSEPLSDIDASKCPMHEIRKVPIDGTPLSPSAVFDEWRKEGAATPLEYEDGHQGLVVTRYELAKLILEDKRFGRLASQEGHVLRHRIAWCLVIICRHKFLSVLNAKHLNHLTVQNWEVVNLRRTLSQLNDCLVLHDPLSHRRTVGITDWNN